MKDYLFLYKNENRIDYGKVVKNKLEVYKKLNLEDIQIGDIYRVYVKKQVKSINAYFVSLDNEIEGFLDFKDVIGKIKLGDTILVEVYKINQGNKAPNVSMNISVSSPYSVVTLKKTPVNISRKITKLTEDLKRLKEIDFKYGVKLRTNSVNNNFLFLKDDIEKNIQKMDEINNEKNLLPTPKKVYSKNNIIEEFLIKNSNNICVINDKKTYTNLKNNINIENKLIYNDEYNPVYDYNIGNYLNTLDKTVVSFEDINIFIEETEALTVIDINSKKYNNANNKSENALEVNTIAIKEIIRQIKFRNISGIIIIDFINMKSNEMKIFNEYINLLTIEDNRKWSFHGFTKLGLYEITRQRGK